MVLLFKYENTIIKQIIDAFINRESIYKSVISVKILLHK